MTWRRLPAVCVALPFAALLLTSCSNNRIVNTGPICQVTGIDFRGVHFEHANRRFGHQTAREHPGELLGYGRRSTCEGSKETSVRVFKIRQMPPSRAVLVETSDQTGGPPSHNLSIMVPQAPE